MTRGRAGRMERVVFMILVFELIVLIQGCFRVANRCTAFKIFWVRLVMPFLIQSPCQLMPRFYFSQIQLVNF